MNLTQVCLVTRTLLIVDSQSEDEDGLPVGRRKHSTVSIPPPPPPMPSGEKVAAPAAPAATPAAAKPKPSISRSNN